MQDEQKQIEEMAKVIMGAVPITIQYVQAPANETEARIEAKALIAAGYRKQSDTAREILKWLKLLYSGRQKEYTNWDGNKISAVTTEQLNTDIETIAAEYGVEVEE